MDTKTVKSLVIIRNDGTAIKLKHQQFRQEIDKAYQKFHNLVEKFKTIEKR